MTHLVGKAGRQRHGDRHHWDKRRRVHAVDLDLLGHLDAGELMDRDGLGDVDRGSLQSRRGSGASRRVEPVHRDRRSDSLRHAATGSRKLIVC